ncbi:hypothetical protein [Blastomonas aquatica]|uniref:hypothetical protein n=1 Tax=Blastomonas aquatica TaxID=1510276 RepID=UPI00166C5FF9|nr:hypothetical protein [Blastomonas aquatica]
MAVKQSYRNWWRPLPAWVKAATTLVAFPAWLFIVYCIVTGNLKSLEALSAFGVFAVVVVLHIVFDRRTRRGAPERHGGADLIDGE